MTTMRGHLSIEPDGPQSIAADTEHLTVDLGDGTGPSVWVWLRTEHEAQALIDAAAAVKAEMAFRRRGGSPLHRCSCDSCLDAEARADATDTVRVLGTSWK